MSLLHFQGTMHGSHYCFSVGSEKQQHPQLGKARLCNEYTDQGSTNSIRVWIWHYVMLEEEEKNPFNNEIPAADLLIQTVMCCLFLQTLPHLEQAAVQLPLPWFLQEREGKVWNFVREANNVEHVAKTTDMEELTRYLQLVLKLQELKHHYEDAG